MATLGSSTSAPTFGNFFQSGSVQNAVWGGYTMPSPGGLVTSLSAYFDVETGGPAGCYLCMWDFNTGALLASVAVASIPNGSNSAGGQAWHTASLATPVYITSGRQVSIGFWVPQANGFTTSYYNSGTSFWNTQAGSSPGTSSNGTTGFGAIGSYATYTPGGAAWVNTGTPGSPVWTAGQVFVNTGTSGSPVWTAAEVDVNTGTPGSPVWTPAG